MAIYMLIFFHIIFYLCKSLIQKRNRSCYLLHYECFKAADDRKLGIEENAKIILRNKNLGLEEYKFVLKTFGRSGMGQETYGPRSVIDGREENPTLIDALSDVDESIFTVLDNLFAKTGVSPSEIDILVVNLSLFSPAPSITSRVVNRYKMRDDVKTFNLSGMGCSASVIAIDLVQHLFNCYKNKLALVVSAEAMVPHWYCGNKKSMMLPNCLFRSGGCSMLLTNNNALKHRAILKLKLAVRTHMGSDDEGYSCCIQDADDKGYEGFVLSKSLPRVGAKAMATNLRVLLPKVLPLTELLRYVVSSLLANKISVRRSSGTSVTPANEYPGGGARLNLKTGIHHFCIHPGGKAVIEGISKSLGLSEYDVEASKMALHRFGNTSVAGIWYVFAYLEAKERLKKGDRILMIGLGAGFKCSNCVWEVMRELKGRENVWKDFIDKYPEASMVEDPVFQEYYQKVVVEEDANFIRDVMLRSK